MMEIYEVKEVRKTAKLIDKFLDNHDGCFLTLADIDSNSENRYYIRLSGREAAINWHEGDRLMLNLSLCAYKSQGQWHLNTYEDTIKLIEIKS